MRNDFESNYLAHYGILGQKWGVRRYQNYDGSYTQKGLKRYREDQQKYEAAKKHRKDIQASGGGKEALKIAKYDEKVARKEMNKSYKRLKEHKMADQGKRLYATGHTITGNATMAQIAAYTVSGTAAASGYLAKNGETKLAQYAALAGIGATAVEGILMAKNAYQDRRLRAYYGHHQ